MAEKKAKKTIGPGSEAHKKFLNCKSDFIIFGGGAGSGKSYQALMLVLKYIKDPHFKAVFIRQTSTQLSQPGGLYPVAEAMWQPYKPRMKTHPHMTATFPSGAQVQFRGCEYDKDVYNFDGLQASLVVFDEAQWHSEAQIKYLESRVRSEAKGPHQLICTANPSKTSYLYQFVQPYLDMETGIPIAELSGIERYYLTYGGTTHTAATVAELQEKFGANVKWQSYTYIAATVKDNPDMLRLNPGYVSRLENLKRTERERLYLGSWHAKEEAASLFRREWVEEIDCPPANIISRARGMDTAGCLPSEAYPNPDWTASVLIGKTKDGYYIVEDVERYRALINGVFKNIVTTDLKDKSFGVETPVYVPTDPAAHGKAASAHFVQYLTEAGVDVRVEAATTKGKLTKMQPFLALAEAGFVKVVKGEWNDMWYDELENFVDGNRKQKDDMWDATGTATKALLSQRNIPQFSMPVNLNPSPIPRV